MSGLFAVDGRLAQILGKLADLVILNLLLILCCIPAVTAGAALTAFYSVLLKLVKDEESYVCRSFFKAFKENFKQSTAVFLIAAGAAAVLGGDVYFWARQQGTAGDAFFVLFSVLAVFLYLWSCYLFPVMAFFENRTGKVFRNSGLLVFAHFPATVLLAVINLVPWFILLFWPFVTAVFFDLILGFSLAGFINACILRKIFQRYIPK